ncbi:MAG: hypothetical protein ACI8UP_003993 [Porticoccaceae bacterium]|jgi:hypothetical protein
MGARVMSKNQIRLCSWNKLSEIKLYGSDIVYISENSLAAYAIH